MNKIENTNEQVETTTEETVSEETTELKVKRVKALKTGVKGGRDNGTSRGYAELLFEHC